MLCQDGSRYFRIGQVRHIRSGFVTLGKVISVFQVSSIIVLLGHGSPP